MGTTEPVYPPHPPKLHCCKACDAFIYWQWQLALRSAYVEPDQAIDEHEPRVDSRWDDVEEQGW